MMTRSSCLTCLSVWVTSALLPTCRDESSPSVPTIVAARSRTPPLPHVMDASSVPRPAACVIHDTRPKSGQCRSGSIKSCIFLDIAHRSRTVRASPHADPVHVPRLRPHCVGALALSGAAPAGGASSSDEDDANTIQHRRLRRPRGRQQGHRRGVHQDARGRGRQVQDLLRRLGRPEPRGRRRPRGRLRPLLRRHRRHPPGRRRPGRRRLGRRRRTRASSRTRSSCSASATATPRTSRTGTTWSSPASRSSRPTRPPPAPPAGTRSRPTAR